MRGKGSSSSSTQENPTADDPELTAMLESITDLTNSILQSLNAQKEMMGQFMETMQKLIERVPKESERERESRVLKDFLQLQSLTFNGGLDAEEAANWVYEMEKSFDVIPYDEPTKVKLAAFMLNGDAFLWWVDTKEKEGEVGTWEGFKGLFLRKYFPKTERYRKGYEFMHLKQGDMTVREYAAKFEKLVRYVRDFRVTNQVGQGLRPSVGASGLEYQEMVDKAETVEFAEECMLADKNKQ